MGQDRDSIQPQPLLEADMETGVQAKTFAAADATSPHDAAYLALFTRFLQYWHADLRVDAFMEFQLLLLTFGTGIQDGISYPDFRCFASNQTGNTVVLAVALAGGAADLFDPVNVGLSLAAFLAGAVLTGRVGIAVGRRRRAWQFGVNLAQTFMVMGAAWIQFVHGVEERGAWARAALALIAFSSGAQVAAARAMKIPEISTAMATAAWVDLLIDENLMTWRNHPRNRRILFLVALVAGSFAGAFARTGVGSPMALVISGVVKALVIGGTLFSKSDRDDEKCG
ncbi:hypothetical protein LTR62_000892 [Meristemomyces frigidus]|uniref:DUF1275 domain protein n=1 Tax=Meristemomyces frigidus TaxID=1508187 RepID=A0AAN7T9U9_9PEZI|nr:hypothetical protein LTR62_000892 [Meristemomyces frigidus]